LLIVKSALTEAAQNCNIKKGELTNAPSRVLLNSRSVIVDRDGAAIRRVILVDAGNDAARRKGQHYPYGD
jgi:hypothetical protein